jgi:hypothetical protein
MWTAIPIQNPEYDFLASDVKIRLRISNPYQKGIYDLSVDSLIVENNNFPYYRFHTIGYAPQTNLTALNDSIMQNIYAVPNPYMWYSYYEVANYEKKMKLINLPERCDINIYNASGEWVHSYQKNDNTTYYSWNLTDRKLQPISSGIYIIHISAPLQGERVLKWAAVMRE